MHRAQRIRIMLAVTAGGALGLSLSNPTDAAPRARRSRATVGGAPRAPIVCAKSTPTKEQCLTAGYLGACPQHTADCKPHGEQAFRDFKKTSAYRSAKTTKVLGPQTDAIPQGLSDAKYFQYRPGKTSRPRITSTNNVLSRTGFDGPSLPPMKTRFNTAKGAHREPKWENNGNHANSCEEFAYEMVYDWGRFSDAAVACKGDWKCELKIAMLPAAPGIAGRTLRRKDGIALPDSLQLVTADKGTRPKNLMFVLPDPADFILAGGPDGKLARTTTNDALIKTLEAGSTHYEMGCTSGCNDRQFKNEWDYHRGLFERNETVSMAEFQEYERRKQEFSRLVLEWRQAREKEKNELFGVPMDVVEFDFVEDWVIDPLKLHKGLEKLQSRTRTRSKTMRKRSGGAKRSKLSKRTARGVSTRRATSKPMPKPTPRKSGRGPSPSTPASKGPKVSGGKHLIPDPCIKWTKTSSNLEHQGIGPLSCRIGQFLREEWARKALGERSCLDMGMDDCDWSPMEFQRRFVHGVPYTDEQQIHELECNEWTPSTAGETIANIDQEITNLKAKAEQGWKDLEPYVTRAGSNVTKLGDSIHQSDSFGDTKWFGAGYNVDVDWSVTPGEADGGNVCKLDGKLETGLDVDVWLIKKKLDLIHANALAEVEGGTSKVKAHGDLSIMGKQVWTDTKEVVAVFEAKKTEKKTVPKNKPKFQVAVAGAINIMGSAWGELMYGAGVKIRGRSEAHDCNVQDIKFGMGMSGSPFFMATGFAQIGAGIPGVAAAHIRGGVNLVTLSLPLQAGVDARVASTTGGNLESAHLDFDLDWSMHISSLSGTIWVVIEVVGIESAHEIFDWSGLSHGIPLFAPFKTSIPLSSWKG